MCFETKTAPGPDPGRRARRVTLVDVTAGSVSMATQSAALSGDSNRRGRAARPADADSLIRPQRFANLVLQSARPSD